MPSRYSVPPSAITELVAITVLSRSKNAASTGRSLLGLDVEGDALLRRIERAQQCPENLERSVGTERGCSFARAEELDAGGELRPEGRRGIVVERVQRANFTLSIHNRCRLTRRCATHADAARRSGATLRVRRGLPLLSERCRGTRRAARDVRRILVAQSDDLDVGALGNSSCRNEHEADQREDEAEPLSPLEVFAQDHPREHGSEARREPRRDRQRSRPSLAAPR